MRWESILKRESIDYECGYCGNQVASELGWTGIEEKARYVAGEIRVCHRCTNPTYWRTQHPVMQVPSPMPGADVSHVPDDIKALYDEARRSFSANAYTAAVLALRKLLMHVAVAKGAAKNLNFVQYVEYLDKNGHLGAGGKDWVDVIRTKGNEANHEIVLMSQDDALHVLGLAEMLLKLVYEFPGRVKPPSKPTP
jgi:hypothetical protein